MRIVVTGPRTWPIDRPEIIHKVLKPYTVDEFRDNQLAQGGARGVDRIAREFWDLNHPTDLAFEYAADWDRDGKAAGPIRNREMLEDFEPDLVLAFLIPEQECRGTWDCIEQALRFGIEVRPFRLK